MIVKHKTDISVLVLLTNNLLVDTIPPPRLHWLYYLSLWQFITAFQLYMGVMVSFSPKAIFTQ